jgi:amino acid adenylation domain-containing protein
MTAQNCPPGEVPTDGRPLSFASLLDPEVLANPYPLYHRLRRESPVHWDPLLRVWVVTRYDDCVRVLRDFSAERTPRPEQLTALGLSALNPVARVMVRMMLFLDPPAHVRIRSLASAAFTPHRVEALRSHIRDIVRNLLQPAVSRGQMDLLAELAEPLPCIVTAEMLGVPVEDHRQLKLWSQDFAEILGNLQHNPDHVKRILKCTEEMTAYFRSAMRSDTLRPEGLVCSLKNAEIKGDRLTEEEVIANCIITLVGGQETTTNLIANGVLALLRNPGQLEKLRANPSLVPPAVEELLRYESPTQYTARLATEDTDLGGKPIRKRQAVFAVLGAGNRDPEQFEDPDRLDIARENNKHLAFGWGGHFCFGAPLARIEGQIAFEELLRLPNWSLAPGPLVWRTNLALRGLTALPVRFTGAPQENAVAKLESAARTATFACPVNGLEARANPPPAKATRVSATLSPLKQALRERLLQRASRGLAPHSEIPVRPDRGVAPLSSSQRQMWLMDQMTPGNPAYNLSIGYRLRGPLEAAALEAGFNEVIKRHEVLRSTFANRDGEPLQFIHPELKLRLDVRELDQLNGEERERRLRDMAAEESVKPFDLSRLPLIRAALIKLGKAEHVLVISVHHIVADGLSVGLLLKELDVFYLAFTGHERGRLPELPVQYADYALWQQQTIANEAAYASQIKFWQKRLSGPLPVLELPADKARPAIQSFNGSNVFFNLSAARARELRALGERESCTPFMTLLGAFQVLLQRYSGAEDIVIGTPLAVRTRVELEPLIGNFLNMAALRCDLSGDPTFMELLRRTRDLTLKTLSNNGLPYAALMKHLKLDRDPSRNPVFQVLFEVTAAPAPGLGGLEINSYPFDLKTAQFDLSLHFEEEAGGFLARVEYCTDVFEAETVERLSANYLRLLQAIVDDPEQRISDLPVLAEPESNQILNQWNDTHAALRTESPFHQLFETQAERGPERIALLAGDTLLSYAELDARANRVSQELRSRGVTRGQRVGLCVERGADMLVAQLGILKAGAAYVPLDPSYPEDRLRFMADDAQLAALVSTAGLAGSFGLPRDRQLLLDADAERIAAAPDTPLPADAASAQPGDAAYVIYTSGSTGKPKGVVIPHRAVVNFLASMAREPGLAPDDVLVAVTTVCFDIAVLELHLPLTVGARVVIANRDQTVDGRELGALLDRHRATVMQATPVTWRLLLESGWKPSGRFKALVGGDALPRALADRLIASGVELWNMYGPTETTIWSTCARIADTSAGIPIGRPIANTTVRVLDERRHLCPVGVPGELCIGGAGLALGYWNRPELTAHRFTPDVWSPRPGARLYLTGDRARWRKDGTLEHLGRLDFQIKLRGVRIEPGEIEAGIARHPAVREAAVIAREDTPGDRRLVAYLVVEHEPADLVAVLRSRLRATMPEYMVPTQFVVLPALPRTRNGKLNRQALPAPESAGEPALHLAVESRTPSESMVIGVFRGVLRRNDVGVSDSFFDLGGDSLMAGRLMFRLRTASGFDLPLVLLFERPTPARLAEAIDRLAWLKQSKTPSPVVAGREEIEV